MESVFDPSLVWTEHSGDGPFKTPLNINVFRGGVHHVQPDDQHVQFLTHQLLTLFCLPSFALSLTAFFILSCTHAYFHSIFLFTANSLFVEEEQEAYLPAIWQCQGRPEQMCSALGICSTKHMHVRIKTHTHRLTQCRGRGHCLTTVLSNFQSAATLAAGAKKKNKKTKTQ